METIRTLVLPLEGAEELAISLENVLGTDPSFDLRKAEKNLLVTHPTDVSQLLSNLQVRFKPDILFICASREGLPQMETILRSSGTNHLKVSIVAVVEAAEPGQLGNFLNLGADEFILAPLRSEDVLARCSRLHRHIAARKKVLQQLKEKNGLYQFIGESQAFLAAVKKIPLIAKGDATVLITGETGTGKELSARAIHYFSARAAKPFVPLNCGAIPLELVENELFGHERGAYTGASSARSGLIHEASGGTLFLDEIDSMPPFAQVKLLRFLQDKEYRPLGATKMIHADVRVIAATNASASELVRSGKLRQDLYYRLNTISLPLPPMRERRDDIPLLARHFIAKTADRLCTQPKDISAGAVQKLLHYDWPGNVRELEHAMERAVVLSECAVIGETDIDLPGGKHVAHSGSFREAKADAVAQFERAYIQEILLAHQGNITKAAQTAQKNRRAFWQLLKKHHLSAHRLRPEAR